MNITATIIAQGVTFLLFILLTAKVVWPPISRAMKEREDKIADGLAAAERGSRDLELAQERSDELLKEAREQAADVLAQANKRSNEMIEAAKEDARQEGERMISAAKAEIDQELGRAREELRNELARLATAGASQILEREIDEKTHKDLIDKMASEL